jgi:hypothetical protein
MLLLDEHDLGVGCAIFVSPTTAVTCFHNVKGYEGDRIEGVLDDGTRLTLKMREVSDDDKALDVAALDIVGKDKRKRTRSIFLR